MVESGLGRLSRVPKYLYIIFVGFDSFVLYLYCTVQYYIYCSVHIRKTQTRQRRRNIYATIVIIIIVCASLIVLARPVNNLYGERGPGGDDGGLAGDAIIRLEVAHPAEYK